MRITLLVVLFLLAGCFSEWKNGPYETYWIDGVKSLGYSVGDGMYIRRMESPKFINANGKYISIYACPEGSCAYYYIDRTKDHKFADFDEFVYGPFTSDAFKDIQEKLLLPKLKIK